MKIIIIFLFSFGVSQLMLGQASGNVNYQNQVRFPDKTIDVRFTSGRDIVLSVKGLHNVKTDAYVAIFNVTQVGNTTTEVNELLSDRIAKLKRAMLEKPATLFVDMVSFVPVYEYELEKKIFSKKTYNEIPKGFELKKNLHIKFTEPDFLNELIAICAQVEVYDLVRVDYISDSIEQKKRMLVEKAKALIEAKIKDHQVLLGADLAGLERDIADGFKVLYPVEMYKSYQAYSSSSLNLKKSAKTHQAAKSTVLYYQPVFDKEFDFVINPTIVEPVIQILYEIKLKIKRKPIPLPVQLKREKEYILISPAGELKRLNVGG